MSEGERSPLLGNSQEEDRLQDDVEVELRGCGATAACDPMRPYHRYCVLFVMCFLSFGSYFCYDNPAALQDRIENDLKINTSEFMQLYSFYSWPNVVLCFFGGFLIDRVFGIRLGAIIFSTFVVVGQLLFAAGAYTGSLWLMCAGRFIFGIGGESLCVGQNTYAVSWFKGRELNMVFGLQLSFSRVGSTVNMNIMEKVYQWVETWGFNGHQCLGVTLFIAAAFCFFSLVCALLMAFFDKRANAILKTDEAKTGEVIKFSDIKNFNSGLWFICIICVAYYVAVFPFIGLGLVFFEMKWGYTPSKANAVNSLVYIISAVASPISGFCIDKTGKNIFWVISGTAVTLGCHALLAFTFLNPFIAMIIMGLAYSVLASSLWPMVAMVIPEQCLATAYGLMQSVQNLGLATISLAAGKIVDLKGYLILEVFFLCWLCVALIAEASLYILDAARGCILNRSAKERHLQAEADEESKKDH
ncbi:hypothetical protein CAPTEDRAFT_162862 [Capitella teleta]|uniref:Lysosomal dipeptide transporter MFSD1 n=1 Tax=Capitella teleta TaxID=283909 RepID=R7U7C6_CAPTE|nr:hypothetical protein CAPTEDRAFT_162862 [Capitella teleta]|eukprot:ELT99040.1 hypothetical protein CAPTEDRAFT_162862 [Capitella teleta]